MIFLVFIGVFLLGISPIFADTNDTSQAYGGSGINFLLQNGLEDTAFDCDPTNKDNCYTLNYEACKGGAIDISLSANFVNSTINCDDSSYRKIWISTDASCQDTSSTTYLTTKYNLNSTDTESGIYQLCNNTVDYFPNQNLKESAFSSSTIFEAAQENDSCSVGVEQTLYLCYAIGPTDGGSSNANSVYGWHKFKVDTKIPSAPTVTTQEGDGTVIVKYTTADSDVFKATVYYQKDDGASDADCRNWSNPSSASYNGNKTSGEVEIKGLENGVKYQYCVVVVDDLGNTSEPTPVATFGAVDECDFWECAPEELGNGGFCFVATAAYGADDPVLETLRRFRDTVLMKSNPGRWFIYTYYRLSPPLAKLIALHPVLRLTTRILLTPVQLAAQAIMFIGTHRAISLSAFLVLLAMAACCGLRSRRKHEI